MLTTTYTTTEPATVELTRIELIALTRKMRSGRFANHAPSFFARLESKGMIEPGTRRLTDAGKSAVDSSRRLEAQSRAYGISGM